jgi:hypothetical protein
MNGDVRQSSAKSPSIEQVQISIINIVKTSRLRYAGHMIRRPEDLPQKAIFIARPQGTRRQERPKSRWADGVISDSRALGAPDWTNRAQDTQ